MYVNKKELCKMGQRVFLCVLRIIKVYVKYIFMEYAYNVKIIYLIL